MDEAARELRPGEPCSHPGCLQHWSHPCEGCGRIGGMPADGEVRTYTEMPWGSWYIEDLAGERCIAVAEGLGKASERFGTFYRRGGVLGRVLSSGWHKLNSPQMPLVASRFEAAANLWAWARNQQHPRFRIVEGTLSEGNCCPKRADGARGKGRGTGRTR